MPIHPTAVRIFRGTGRAENMRKTGISWLMRSFSHRDETRTFIPTRAGIISTIRISADISPVIHPDARDKAVVPKSRKGNLSPGPSGEDAPLNAP